MQSSTRARFVALCSVPFVMVLSNSMLIPVLPSMQAAMNLTLFQAGLIITAFSVPAGLFIPLGGFLSDRFGRKVIMVPALAIFGLGGLLAGLAPILFDRPFAPLLVGRVVQGIGAGGTYQLAMSLTGDIFQSEERAKALGLLEASNGLGKVVSPLIGSLTGLIQWFAPFFVYPLLSWLSGGWVWWQVREGEQGPRKPTSGSRYLRSLGGIARQKGISLAINFLGGFTALFVLFGVLSVYSDILEKTYHIFGLTKGLVIALPVLVLALTSYFTGTYAQKALMRLVKPVATGGLLLIAGGMTVLVLFRGLVPFSIGVALLGLGAGLLLPAVNTMITSAAERQERGLITAFYGSVRFFGAALGPPAFGLAIESGPLAAYGGAGALAILGAGLMLTLVKVEVLLPRQLAGGRGSSSRPERWDADIARTMDDPAPAAGRFWRKPRRDKGRP